MEINNSLRDAERATLVLQAIATKIIKLIE